MIEGVYKIFNDLSLYGLEKLGLYLSKYRGFVASVDDPKGYSRLQLQVPDVYGDSTYPYWAWPSNNFSGIGYGCQVLPRTNDLVWVEFERGNPKKPIWSHGHFGKGEKPDNLKNPKNYWFKTPGGNLVELDDDNKRILVTNIKGHTLEMSEDAIILKVVGGKKIQLNGNQDNIVKYLPISQSMTQLAQDINTQLNLISAGIATAGGSYVPTPIVIDISDAKVDDVQTP